MCSQGIRSLLIKFALQYTIPPYSPRAVLLATELTHDSKGVVPLESSSTFPYPLLHEILPILEQNSGFLRTEFYPLHAGNEAVPNFPELPSKIQSEFVHFVVLVAANFEGYLPAVDHEFSCLFQPLESGSTLFLLSTSHLPSSYASNEVDFKHLHSHKLSDINACVMHNPRDVPHMLNHTALCVKFTCILQLHK